MTLSESKRKALEVLHTRIKAAIADVPDNRRSSPIVAVLVDAIAWLIVQTIAPEHVEQATTMTVRVLRERVAHHRDEKQEKSTPTLQ